MAAGCSSDVVLLFLSRASFISLSSLCPYVPTGPKPPLQGGFRSAPSIPSGCSVRFCCSYCCCRWSSVIAELRHPTGSSWGVVPWSRTAGAWQAAYAVSTIATIASIAGSDRRWTDRWLREGDQRSSVRLRQSKGPLLFPLELTPSFSWPDRPTEQRRASSDRTHTPHPVYFPNKQTYAAADG